jgi:UDP-galactopyranose mutase
MKFIIVGAGLSGSTCARLLAEWGNKVLVVECRNHVAGNCYDAYHTISENKSVPYHAYGPHFFHTNNEEVFNFLNKFSHGVIPYQHKAKIQLQDFITNFPPMPSILEQLGVDKNMLPMYSPDFNEEAVFNKSKNAEDYLLNTIGQKLCDTIYRVYTERHWNKPLNEVPAFIVRRVKLSDHDGYFKDKYQCLPLIGYTSFVKNVLDHENIDLLLGFDFLKHRSELDLKNVQIVYTGKVDAYFDYMYGQLEYVSVKTVKKIERVEHQLSGNSVQLNFGIPIRYSRVISYSKLRNIYPDGKELLVYEEPIHGLNKDTADSFVGYPLPTENNMKMLQLYFEAANKINNLTLVGRLAEYRYMNMDQTIENAMKICDKWKPK